MNIRRNDPLHFKNRFRCWSGRISFQRHFPVVLAIAAMVLLSFPSQSCAATLTGMGTALSFNGSNQYVYFSDSSVPNASTSVTIECWVKMTDSVAGQGIVDRGRNLSGNWWLLTSGAFDSRQRGVVFGGHGIGELRYGWNDTDWHHVAGVYDGVTHTLRLYVDGVERGSHTDWTAQLDTGSAPLRLGGRANAGSADNFFSGSLDEVRIWSTARTGDDIETGMSIPLKGNEANLTGYWHFGEGSGPSAYDYSTGSATGTLVNAPAWVNAAIPVRASAYEVSTLLLQLGGTDTVNDGAQQAGTVRVKITSLPAHGVLYELGGGLGKDPVVLNTLVGNTETGDGNRVIYRANAGYIGTDSFTYRTVSVAADNTESPAATDGTVNIEIMALPPGYITTVAGNGCVGFFGDGSSATGACLNNPNAVAVGPTGILYISDQQNNRIRSVDTAGTINTHIKPPEASSDPWYISLFATAANKVFTHKFTNNKILGHDTASEFYAKGGLPQYFANEVYAVNPADVSVAMQGATVLSESAMRGWKAILGWFGVDTSTPPDWIDWPRGLNVGPDGTLYYTSMYSFSVFKKQGSADPSYVAGTGATMLDSIYTHPDAADFSFSLPEDVAVDNAGNKYVVDTGFNKVYKVTPDGKIHHFCGAGWEQAAMGFVWSEGSNCTWADLSWVTAVAVDPVTQYVYIADAGHNRILAVHTDVSWTPSYTVAGDRSAYHTAGYSGDGGPAASALLNFPAGLGFDRSGNLYVAEMGNERIRMIGTNGLILTLAGNGVPTYNGDGIPAAEAGLNYVEDVAADSDGNLYIADRGNHRVRKVKSFGTLGINGTAEFTNRTAVVLAMHNPFAGTCSKMRFSTDSLNWSDWEKFETTKAWTLPGGDGLKTVYAQFSDGASVVSASDTITLDTTPPTPTFAINFASKATSTTDVTLTVTGTDASGISQMIFTNLDAESEMQWEPNHAELQPFASTTKWNLHYDLSAATTGPESVAPGVKTVYARFKDNAGNVSPVLSAQIVWDPNPPVVTVVANGGFPYTGEQVAHLTIGASSVSGAATVSFSTDNATWSAPEPFAATKALPFSAVNGLNTIYARVTSNAGLTGQASATLFYNPTISAATIATSGGNGTTGSLVVNGGDRIGIGSYSGDGGSAALAAMNGPTSVSVDPFGSVYVTDWGNRRVRKIDSLGMINTYAGTGDPGWSGDGGLSTLARINGDWGVHAATSADLLLSGHPYGDYLGELSLVRGYCPISFYTPSMNARPGGTATDADGNLYFADTNNHRVRKIVRTTGVITTVAGNGTRGFSGDSGPAMAAEFDEPTGVAVDGAGRIYIADSRNHRIRKVENNIITTIAGTGTSGFSGDNGQAVSAMLNLPADVVVDGAGNLFISDTDNRRIRKIDPAGTITTFAGTGASGYSGDLGAATSATMGRPQGMSLDGAGSLYFADTDNNAVRKIEAATGIIWTVAGTGVYGSGADGGTARTTALASPTGVAVDSAGYLYITEAGGHHLRKVSGFIALNGGAPDTTDPTVTLNLACPHFEGCSNMQLSGDGTAWLSAETYAATRTWTITGGDGFRRVYARFQNGTSGTWSDVYNDGIMLDTTAPAITQPDILVTAAGNGRKQVIINTSEYMGTYSGDNGPAPAAGINRPEAVAFDSSGNLYIADSRNYRVRMVTPAGVITTVAGNGSQAFDNSMNNGPATAAAIGYPSGVAVSGADLYISDSYNNRIYRVAGGVITTFAGTGAAGFSGDGGPATSAQLHDPQRMTFDGNGNLFFVDSLNFRVRKISSGTISTVAGNGSFGTSGSGGPAVNAPLSNPHDVAVAADGTLYIAEEYHRSYQDDIYYQLDVHGQCNQHSTTKETDDGMVRKVTPEGTILAFAGGPANSRSYSGDGGPAAAAELSRVSGLDLDGSGNLYIADLGNRRIRKVTASTGVITTVAGNGSSGYAGNGYAGLTTSVDSPYDVALSPSGTLHIADRDNQMVRKLVAAYTATPAVTNSTSIVFNVASSETGTTYECSLDAAGFAPCASTVAYANFADGTHRLTVRPTDAVGNAGTSVVYTWTIDTLPPLTTFTQTPALHSKIVNPSFAFIANESVNGFSCRLDSGVEGACTSPFTLTSLSEGLHTFYVRATDTAGNRPDMPTSFAWTVDISNPVVTFSDHPAAVTRSTDAAFSFSADETVTGYQCSLDGAAFADCTSPVSYTGLAAGSHEFRVKAADLAGNSGSAAYTWLIDRTASALIIDPVTSPTIVVKPVISGTVDKQGCTVTVTSPTPGCNGQAVMNATDWSFNQCVLSAGTNTITVTAVDPAGNITTGSISVDYVARNLDYVLKNVFTAGYDIAVDKDGSLYYHDYYMDGSTTVHTISKRDVFTGLISRVAGGNGAAPADGVAALQARFYWPMGLAVDNDYNLYISDDTSVYKVSSGPTGTVSVLATGLSDPGKLALDTQGNIYVADRVYNGVIKKIDGVTHALTVVAGGGSTEDNMDYSTWVETDYSGPATGFRLSGLKGIAVDGTGNIYFNHTYQEWVHSQFIARTRKVEAGTGLVFTVAGFSYPQGNSGDNGPALQAKLGTPRDSVVDSSGNVYIADDGFMVVRVVEPVSASRSDAMIYHYAGTVNGAMPPASAPLANLQKPLGIVADPAGRIYLSSWESDYHKHILKIDGMIEINHGAGSTKSAEVNLTLLPPFNGGAAYMKVSNLPDLSDATAEAYAISKTWTVPSGDGVKRVYVQFQNAAGEWSGIYYASVMLDTATAVSINPVAGPTPLSSQTVTGTCEAGSTVIVTAGGNVNSPATVTGATWQIAVTGLQEGTNPVVVTAVDLAGNIATAQAALVRDTAPPVTHIVAQPPALSSLTTVTFQVVCSDLNCSYEYKLDDGAYSAPANTATVTYSSLADEGTHTFSVRTTDAAGNTAEPVTYSWTLDLTPPDTSITAAPAEMTCLATSATFSFTSTKQGSSFLCKLDQPDYIDENNITWSGKGSFVPCSSPKTYSGLNLDGVYTLTVKAVDGAGNVDPSPSVYTWGVAQSSPSVTQQPVNRTAAAGGTALFSAAASGAVSVQWQLSSDGGVNFSDFAGATSPTLSFTTAAADEGKLYHAVFSNGCGSVSSSAARLTIDGTAPTGKTWWTIPRTGQTACYNASGTVIPCAGTGQDGELQKGAEWPSPRFVVSSSGTGNVVTDRLTGLMWPKDAGAPTVGSCTGGKMTAIAALSYVSCLNSAGYLGHDDWRLPNIVELESLLNTGQAYPYQWLTTQGFTNFDGNSPYWSSSASSYDPTRYNRYVDFSLGKVIFSYKNNGVNYNVLPVRGAQAGGFGDSSMTLLRTGQTTGYAAGDDGDLRQGLAWPSPRFTDKGDRTVLDNATGLVWQQDGSTPAVADCTGGQKNWQGALDYAACLNRNNYLGHTDWRLPNIRELASLLNNGASDQTTWLNSQGFTNTQEARYWSSSSAPFYASYAWSMYFGTSNDGRIDVDWGTKDYSFSVRAVRSGDAGMYGATGIAINNGAEVTTSTTVTLSLFATDANSVAGMMISNDSAFTGAVEEAYATSKSWGLAAGTDGARTVYAKFKDAVGNWSASYSDTILFDTTAPVTTAAPESGVYQTGQSITLSCSDGTGIGCARTYYTTDGSTPTTSSPVYSGAVSITADSTLVLKFFSMDRAGNQEPVSTQTYTISTIGPTGQAWWTYGGTGQTATYADGDDGSLRTGAAWPNPRFVVSGSGAGTVVTDNLTGLIWQQDGSTPTVGACTGGLKNWQNAFAYVSCLNGISYLGHDDWRLPNKLELESLVNLGRTDQAVWLNSLGFTNTQSSGNSGNYWSSSTFAENTSSAWFVSFNTGSVLDDQLKTTQFNVRCVRGGGAATFGAAPVSLVRTGQTTSYTASDDGDLQKGVAWPAQRFTVNTDQTITDRLTGLTWQRDGNTPAVGSCGGGDKTWQEAMSYAGCLNSSNYLGHNDWRVPNRSELQSITNAGVNNSGGAWWNTQGFTNPPPWGLSYWSSNTYAGSSDYAWLVYYNGYSPANAKSNTNKVRCVRGGQQGAFGSAGIAINQGAASTTSQNVTLFLSATDGNGVASMMISNTADFSGASEEAYASTKAWTLTNSDGAKTVYARFKDNAGTWSTDYSTSIIFDESAPVTTASPAGGNVLSAQTVTLACSDGAGIGCAKTYYTLDGTNPTTSSAVYSAALNVAPDTVLKFFSVDSLGHTETIKTENYIKIKTPQNITLTSSAPASAGYGESFTVAATASSNLNVAISTSGSCSGGGTGSATVTMTGNSGVCTIRYNQAGNGDYYAAEEVVESTTARKADGAITMSMTAGRNPSAQGEQVTFRASISSAATGTISFSEGETTLCAAVTISSGQASCSVSDLALGSHTIAASYPGDVNFNASTGTITQIVRQASSILLAASTPTSLYGESVIFTTTITAGGTGTVTLSEGGTTYCASAVAGGQATCTVSSTGVGAHEVTATYSGDADYVSSTATANLTVNRANTTTAIVSQSSATTSAIQSFTVNYSVSANAPGGGTPTGTVTVSDGSASCTGTLPETGCTLTLNMPGTRTLTATYNGSQDFNGSTSDGLSHEVVAPILHTAPAGATTGICEDWAHACDLQYALGLVAMSPPAEIWVKAGTYKPAGGSNRDATFQLVSGIAIYGGFSGTETSRDQRNVSANVTILSGDLQGDDNNTVAYDEPTRADNSCHVISAGNTNLTAVLDGVTISGGNAYNCMENNGGGFYAYNGSPTLMNVIFSNNAATNGGAVYNYGYNDETFRPIFTNVIFKNNAASNGGAVYNYGYYDGGAEPEFSNVSFIGNRALSKGGAMFNHGEYYGTSVPIVTKSTFSGNSASSGGAVYNEAVEGGASTPEFTNVTFSGNTASSNGGAIANHAYGWDGSVNPSFTNVTISGNTANGTGGGIYGYTEDEAGSSPRLVNSIVWNNGNEAIYNNAGDLEISYSIIQDGCPSGSSCDSLITADPLLGALGDYGGTTQTMALLPGSSAIDTGNADTCPAVDQRGIARPQGSACDIGAFESQGFTLVKTGGDNQSTFTGTSFATPLTLAVTANNEPVNGGVVTFTAPGTGAGTNPAVNSATIADGAVSFTATANGTAGSYNVVAGTAGATSVSFSLANVASKLLTINFAGNGGNKVESTSPDQSINCLKGSSSGCSAGFASGAPVTLKATPDWRSTFIGWSGDYVSSDNPGTVTMTADKTVTATFDPVYKVRLMPNADFTGIQDAYAGVSSGSVTIKAQTWSFLEDLLFNIGTAVTLTGGMDASYNPTSGYSTVKSLTVGKGSVVIGNIIIK